MISRRVLLGTGAATAVAAAGLGAAALGHRLDDLARAVGVKPHPESDPADDRLIDRVSREQQVLLATVEATAAAHRTLPLSGFVAISRDQVRAVGRGGSPPDVAGPPADATKAAKALSGAYGVAAGRRVVDAVEAVSPDLARVLGSMSAGLAQCARSIGDLP